MNTNIVEISKIGSSTYLKEINDKGLVLKAFMFNKKTDFKIDPFSISLEINNNLSGLIEFKLERIVLENFNGLEIKNSDNYSEYFIIESFLQALSIGKYFTGEELIIKEDDNTGDSQNPIIDEDAFILKEITYEQQLFNLSTDDVILIPAIQDKIIVPDKILVQMNSQTSPFSDSDAYINFKFFNDFENILYSEIPFNPSDLSNGNQPSGVNSWLITQLSQVQDYHNLSNKDFIFNFSQNSTGGELNLKITVFYYEVDLLNVQV